MAAVGADVGTVLPTLTPGAIVFEPRLESWECGTVAIKKAEPRIAPTTCGSEVGWEGAWWRGGWVGGWREGGWLGGGGEGEWAVEEREGGWR